MKGRWIALASVLLGATTAAAAVQRAADVAYCMYCTTDAEFAAAGAGEFGAATNPPPAVLVVNPDTADARRVTLGRSADGRMRVSMTSSLDAADVERLADPHLKADIFVPACNGVTRVSPSGDADTVTQAGNAGRKVERGTFVALADGVYGVVLCRSPAFATYSTADHAALAAALHAAQLRWQVGTFKGAAGTYGKRQSGTGTHLVPTPEPRLVCAIFNNGDSACYRGNGARPGTDGQHAGGADAAGASTGMAIVNKGASIQWGAPGSTGRAGETWIVCRSADKQISHCIATRKQAGGPHA